MLFRSANSDELRESATISKVIPRRACRSSMSRPVRSDRDLSVGVGMALNARLDKFDYNTYVLLGDGECAEGSVWEAASLAGTYKLNNLVAIIDVNRLGQSQETAFGHDTEVYEKRFEAFGWRTEVIDGHDMEEILEVLAFVGADDQPLAIIAKTTKGHGISFADDKDAWHGKALNKEEAAQAIAELQPKAQIGFGRENSSADPGTEPEHAMRRPAIRRSITNSATRLPRAKPTAPRWFASAKPMPRIVAMDGDTKNSTYSEKFYKKFPDRFTECFIAEQNMVGVAIGFAALRKIPFASTFAAFFSRAHDQIRMGAISLANIKLVGSHVGVSIGEDGGSQMALEDLAMMRAMPGSVVFYPSDAVSAEKCSKNWRRQRHLATCAPPVPRRRSSTATMRSFRSAAQRFSNRLRATRSRSFRRRHLVRSLEGGGNLGKGRHHDHGH